MSASVSPSSATVPAGPRRSRTSFAILLAAIVVGGVAWLLKKEDAARYDEPVPRSRYVPGLPLTGVPEVDEELRRSQAELRGREALLRRLEAEQRDARARLEVETKLKEVIDLHKAAVDGALDATRPTPTPSGTPSPR